MIGAAAALSQPSASAGMTRSCHRTTGPIALRAPARAFLVGGVPLVLEALIAGIPERLDPVALGHSRFECAQSLFHIAIQPAYRRVSSLGWSLVGHVP